MRRRLKALLLAAVLMICLVPPEAKKAEASSWVNFGYGYYYIRSNYNGLALDVQGGGDYNTCNVGTYEFNGSNAQVWEIAGSTGSYRIKPRCTASRVLNQYGDYVVSGHNVNLWDDVNDPSQRWVFEACPDNGLYIIRCAGNTNCVLDVASNGNVYVSTYVPGKISQMWTVRHAEISISAGNYRLKNIGNEKYLDVQNGGDYNNCNVGTYWYNGSAAQTWYISGSSNWLRIKPLCTVSRVLNQYGDYVAAGHNVNLWNDLNDGTQRWTLEMVEFPYPYHGYSYGFVIHCVSNPACVLTVDDTGNVRVGVQQPLLYSQIWAIE